MLRSLASPGRWIGRVGAAALGGVLALALVAWAAEPQAPAPAAEELHDYQGVIHCHSLWSHDSKGTQEEIIAAAEKTELDFILMTDHPSEHSLTKALRGRHGRTWFLAGAEVDHWLGIDMRRRTRGRGVAAALGDLLEQDALAFVAHPEEFTDWDLPGYTGMEIYNIHADLKAEDVFRLASRAPRILFDPTMALPSILKAPTRNLKKWDELNQRRRVVGIAGNDSHQNVEILGRKIDKYEVSFGFVNTHLLASELSGEAIRDALVRGRVYVAFEAFGKARGFTCVVESGGETARMGEEITLAPGARLAARAPQAGSWRLVKDGQIIGQGEGNGFTAPLDAPGVYRVEVRTTWRKKVWPWIYGNPIFVRGSGGR
ncbi:MAG: hypothetical protein HZA54_20290 [Planctomycetes bacterium]|nr:hypothetical protein [Planctomycetota bacterium]